MFKATEIISLTLNNPDEYFNSLKRVLVNKSEKFFTEVEKRGAKILKRYRIKNGEKRLWIQKYSFQI